MSLVLPQRIMKCPDNRNGTNPKCPAAGIYVMVYPSDARIFNALAKFSSFTRI